MDECEYGLRCEALRKDALIEALTADVQRLQAQRALLEAALLEQSDPKLDGHAQRWAHYHATKHEARKRLPEDAAWWLVKRATDAEWRSCQAWVGPKAPTQRSYAGAAATDG